MANGFTHFIYNILHELYYYSPLHISDKPDFITLYFPLALLATTTLVEPERLCYLRTHMVQRMHFFVCATQNHPIILRNLQIIIMRYLMAQKSDEDRKKPPHFRGGFFITGKILAFSLFSSLVTSTM